MPKPTKEAMKQPKLRFPEFEGDWEVKKLGDICSKIGSGSTPKGGIKVYTESGIPFIRSQNIIDNQLKLDNTHIPITVHEKMNGSKVLSNDILLNITGGSIGRSCVVPDQFKEGNVNQHVSIIRLKNDNSTFLQLILSAYRGQKLIYQGMTGSGREGLNFQTIRSFKVHFPSLPEQQKIASFLSAIDHKRQLLAKQKTLWTQYKKGMMQQLFSQQIRFKQESGEDFADWEEKRLGEIFNISAGGDISKQNVSKEKTAEFKYNIYANSKQNKGHYGYTNIYKVDGEVVTVTGRGINVGIAHARKEKFYPIVRLLVLKPKAELDTIFFEFGINNLYIFIESTGVPQLTAPQLRTYKIKFPSLPEQTLIASFLTSIDQKIQLLDQQIKLMDQYKRGLLQQLFC